MKQSIFLILLICGFGFSTKADTIDYWRVYYNDSLIGKYSSLDSITIKEKKVKHNDYIVIEFVSENICNECLIEFNLYGLNKLSYNNKYFVAYGRKGLTFFIGEYIALTHNDIISFVVTYKNFDEIIERELFRLIIIE